VPPNPAELLLNGRFGETIENLSKDYDFVLIDTPPILAVTDPAIIGRLAGINFAVLRANAHPMREIEHTVKRLRQNGIKLHGFIFNDIPFRTGYGDLGSGKYAYHYQYEYK
jgi:tyrosine-protein kinase Etk/Wzc